jgi:hypothetical protein
MPERTAPGGLRGPSPDIAQQTPPSVGWPSEIGPPRGPATPPPSPQNPPSLQNPSAPVSPAIAQRPVEPPPIGLDGYCPVQLLENNRWVRGTHEGGVIHRGRLYLCATPEERQRFMANPDLYAPVLDGCDVVLAVDQNQLVPGQRKYGVRYEKDNRVYLFSSQASGDRFAQDPGRYANYANAVLRAMASSSQRTAPPESPYGTSPGVPQVGRY